MRETENLIASTKTPFSSVLFHYNKCSIQNFNNSGKNGHHLHINYPSITHLKSHLFHLFNHTIYITRSIEIGLQIDVYTQTVSKL